MKEHLVLIGLNFQPVRNTGDKNFWVELLPLLAVQLERITVISIRSTDIPVETLRIKNCTLEIRYLAPRILATPGEEPGRGKNLPGLWKGGGFPAMWGIAEKLASLRRIARELEEIAGVHPLTHIHLMDNLGPGNRWLARQMAPLKARFSLSAVAYMGKFPLLYHAYLKLSYNIPGVRVVVYAEAYRKLLLGLGLKPDALIYIPWGVRPVAAEPSLAEISNLKKELGLPVEKPLFLWAGLIQQIKEEDFFYALQIAQRALNRGIRVSFFFAFKGESLKKYYTKAHNPARGLFIRATTVEEFGKLKRAAALLYSPLYNPATVLTPPLTWLELLALGKPLLSSTARGIEAVIAEGQTGWVAAGTRQLRNLLMERGLETGGSPGDCRHKISQDYNLEKIARQYLKFWDIPGRAGDGV